MAIPSASPKNASSSPPHRPIASHRTPLTPIHGWLQLLLEKRLDPSKTEEALRVIDRNLMAHTRLVEDLLDVSRVLSGKFEVKQTIVDMRECVTNAVGIHEWTARQKSVSVNLSLSDHPYRVIGDSDRICQIVYNLVHNALKFTPAGGKIDISLTSDGTQAKLSVSDNGVGISPQMLPQLFRRFQQADSSSTRVAGGLGLDRATTRRKTCRHSYCLQSWRGSRSSVYSPFAARD